MAAVFFPKRASEKTVVEQVGLVPKSQQFCGSARRQACVFMKDMIFYGGCAIISFFRQSCNHQVQEYFINLVRCGDLKAGDKLPPEIDLAQSFSISRNTLREALKSLEALGVLETVRGQGTFVTPDVRKCIADMDLVRCFSMENDFQALLEAKNTLVPEMARLAALRRTEEDLAEMGAVLDTPMDSCFSAESMFQIRVASTAKSSVLSGYLRSVYQRLLETEYPKLI